MKVETLKSFEKDIEKINDKKLAIKLIQIIKEIEDAKELSEIKNLKKMKAKGSYYRVRVGNYRVGLKFEKDIIILLRFMHRKDIYNYFP
jgi:mRNA interferase RelE/StbE